jgi:hypothetical protein
MLDRAKSLRFGAAQNSPAGALLERGDAAAGPDKRDDESYQENSQQNQGRRLLRKAQQGVRIEPGPSLNIE